MLVWLISTAKRVLFSVIRMIQGISNYGIEFIPTEYSGFSSWLVEADNKY